MSARPLSLQLLIVCVISPAAGAQTSPPCGELPLPLPQMDMPHDPQRLRIADLNGDGHNDIVTIDRIDRDFSVIFGHGDGTFSEPMVVTTDFGLTAVETADFDRDGDVDVAVAGLLFDPALQGVVSLYRNDDGQLVLVETTEAIGFPEVAAAADFDGDGMIDLAVGVRGSEPSGMEPGVALLRSEGDGFSAPDFTWLDEPVLGLAAGDLDGDGSPDVVVYHEHLGPIRVLFNDGAGHLHPELSIALTRWSRRVELGDLDGNGALDIITSADFVFLNSGDGDFSPPAPIPASSAVADLDLDGDLDLVDGGHSIEFWLNDGAADFQRSFQSSDDSPLRIFPDVTLVAVGQFRGDGTPEIVLAHRHGHELITLLSFVESGDFEHPKHIEADGHIPNLFLSDLDHDGHLDMLYSDDDVFQIRFGGGAGAFGAAESFSVIDEVPRAALADLDQDGAPDVVIGNNEMMRIFMNDGFGTMGLLQTIPLPARGVVAGDFSGDGEIDLAAVSWQEDALTVLKNVDGLFEIRAIYETMDAPVVIEAGDVDGDGWLDAVVGAAGMVGGGGDEYISVFRNNGKGDFRHVDHYEVIRKPSDIKLADLDGDGDQDIASVLSYGGYGYVVIMVNQGDGTFSEMMIIDEGENRARLAPVDFDGDGKLDLIVTNNDDRNLRVLTAVEPGVHYEPQAFAAFEQLVSLAIGDLDGDLDPDIVAGGWDLVVFLNGRCRLGDFDGDGAVGIFDLLHLLGNWGSCPATGECMADLDGDGAVGLTDLLILLDGWG